MGKLIVGACVPEKYVFLMLDGKEVRMTADEAEYNAKQLLFFAEDVKTGRERIREEIEKYKAKHGES